MYIVGIDIAKKSHEAIIIDENGNKVTKSFKFTNNCTGFNKLIENIKKVTNRKSEIVFGMESTSHYWLALRTRLVKTGYAVHVFNPIQSDSLRKMYIRKTKTDSVDSFIIAEVIRFGKFAESQVSAEKISALRELCRGRAYLTDVASDFKHKVTALVDQIFPEYDDVFSSIFVKCSVELLDKYPTPELISKAKTETMSRIIKTESAGYHGEAKAKEIKSLAKSTFGIPDVEAVYSTLIKTYIEQIKFINRQIEDLEKKIADIFDSFETPLKSISGIGGTLGAVILSEIGDISKFSSADKLCAFAGMDPSVKQSGNFVGTHCRMSKRGSPYLRRAIWQASVVAVQSDPMFRAYYQKKLAEGKKHMTVIGHVCKKMLSVIFAVLRDNKAYVPVVKAA